MSANGFNFRHMKQQQNGTVAAIGNAKEVKSDGYLFWNEMIRGSEVIKIKCLFSLGLTKEGFFLLCCLF